MFIYIYAYVYVYVYVFVFGCVYIHMLTDPSLASQEQCVRGSGPEAADIYATSEIAGLFVLFDYFDEAPLLNLLVVKFVKLLLLCEPMHTSVFTSRPRNLGREEFEILQQLGANSFRMSARDMQQGSGQLDGVGPLNGCDGCEGFQ